MERVADYVIGRLAGHGIGHIFLITGRGILYLTDAVARNKEVRGISTYHEQGASYAAMAYAAAKGGMGACLVSTGCAAANAVAAALCAYQDNLPVIFISGQNMLKETTRYTGAPIRTFGSQETDIISMVEPVTKYAVMVERADEIRMVMDQAVYFANEGRKGPVWIDVPLDIQNERIEADALKGWEPPESVCRAKNEEIDYVIERYKQAKRPVLFLGGGVRRADAIHDVAAFAEKYHVPVVFSAAAADAYGAAHTLSIGAVGSIGGSRAGNFAVQNADFILVLGSKLCSQTIGSAKQFAREAKIVVVDIDPKEHTKAGADIDRMILSDIKGFLSDILARNLECVVDHAWVEKCLHWKEIFALQSEDFIRKAVEQGKIDLYYFADVLSGQLQDDAAVITDAGFEELIIPSSIRYQDGQRCLFPAAQGAMGYAVPAILGAHFAGRTCMVAVVGDGSFMMNMQELLAVSMHHIPVKIFVINNNMYAVIRKRQKDLFRARTIGCDPSDGVAAPDFRKIAESFGIAYRLIAAPKQLVLELGAILALDEPCICEVECAEEQNYFHTSFARNESRKLVRRPLEDLSPFLDRDMFFSEMVIDPIRE